MKKNIILLLLLCVFQTTAFAAVKIQKDITLDFTLNYKANTADKHVEHVMKNALKISGNHWHVAGRFQSKKEDEALILLVRLLSQHKGKFTFQFLIVDSDNKNTYITEPKMVLTAGLPAKMTEEGNGRHIVLDSHINLDGTRASL